MAFLPQSREKDISVLIGTVGLGTINAGSTSLAATWTTLPGYPSATTFSASDVGRIVTVMGAGPSGTMLITKVAAFVDATHVTLQDAASTTAVAGVSNTTIFRPVSCAQGTIHFNESLTNNDEAEFTVEVRHGQLPPREGQPVLIQTADSETAVGTTYGVIFGGEIDTVEHTSFAGPAQESQAACKCVAYDAILSRRTISGKQYSSKTMRQIAQDLIDSGLTAEYMSLVWTLSDDGPTPNVVNVDNLSYVADGFNNLITACDSPTTKYYWKTDPWRRIIIATEASVAAPWGINDGDHSDGNILVTVKNTRSREKYSNQVYTQADKALDPPKTVNITNSLFGHPLPAWLAAVYLPEPAAVLPTLSVNGVAMRIWTAPYDPRQSTANGTAFDPSLTTVPAGYDWAWAVNTNLLWTTPVADPFHGHAPMVPPGGTAVATYQVGGPNGSLYGDTTSINTRANIEGGSGLHEMVLKVDNPIDKTELAAETAALAKAYSVVPESIEIISYRGGLRAGQAVLIHLTDILAFGTYLIESAQMETSEGLVKWTLKATLGSLVGDWKTALVDVLGEKILGAGAGAGITPGKIPAPTLTSVTPASGVQGDTVNVTLKGTGFLAGLALVYTDNPDIAVSNLLVPYDDTITATFTIANTAKTGVANVTVSIGSQYTGAASFDVLPLGASTSPAPVLVVTCEDASTLATSDPNYRARWVEKGGALHTVLYATVSMGAVTYPQTLTLKLNGASVPGTGWLGWITIPNDNFAFFLGLRDGTTEVFPPIVTDENWTLLADAGRFDEGWTPTVNALTSSPFIVPAPPAPGTTVVTGAYLDTIIINRATQKWGWKNLYSVLPFDPNATTSDLNPLKAPNKSVKWTIQNGHYTNPADPSTFVPGAPNSAQHGGDEIEFNDFRDALRQPGTDLVTIQNPLLWDIPDAILPDGSTNLDNVFRFKIKLGTYLARSNSDDTTWAYQNAWSTGPGDSTAGTYAYQDVVLDLNLGKQTAANLAGGTKIPTSNIPVDGTYITVDDRGITPVVPLADLFSKIAAANYTIPSAVLANQNFLAFSAAQGALTYASGVIAANVIVDKNVQGVKVSKLLADTVIFSGDVYFARGSGQAAVAMNNGGMYMFSAVAAGGGGTTVGAPETGAGGKPSYTAVGLTGSPYVAVQSSGVYAFSGGSGPSVVITGSAISLYSQTTIPQDINQTYNPALQVSNSPYVTITSAVMSMVAKPFQVDVQASSIQFRYLSDLSVLTSVTSWGFVTQNSHYFAYINASGMMIGKVPANRTVPTPIDIPTMQSSTQYILIGEPTATSGFEVDIVNGTAKLSLTAAECRLTSPGNQFLSLKSGQILLQYDVSNTLAVAPFGNRGLAFTFTSQGLGAVIINNPTLGGVGFEGAFVLGGQSWMDVLGVHIGINSNLYFTSANVVALSAGGATGTYLTIYIAGTTYKLALLSN
jgi:hypothetical protein